MSKAKSSLLLAGHSRRQAENRQQATEYLEVAKLVATGEDIDASLIGAARDFASSQGWNFDADVGVLRQIAEFNKKHPDPEADAAKHFAAACAARDEIEQIERQSRARFLELRQKQMDDHHRGCIIQQFPVTISGFKQSYPHLFLGGVQ